MQGAKCECIHGTCGVHCQRCCSGGAWFPHQPCEEEDRTECSCGERGACSYDDTGAILCVNCTVRIRKFFKVNHHDRMDFRFVTHK